MKRLLSFFLSLVMVFTMTSFSFASDSFSEKYTYPIEPGSEEWANLNHGERVLALQIPEDVLKGMSTENLVETVLNYPCFIDMMFYNTYQEGFDVIKEHFNGIDELLKRDESSKYLLSKYRKQNTKTLLNIRSKEEQFESSLKLTYLETLLAQPEIIEKFSKKENEEVLELVNENYKLHIKNKNELPSLSFSGYTVQTDNGREFCNDREQKKSLFENILSRLGIKHIRTRPYSPWQNGVVERSHKIDNELFYSKRRFRSETEMYKSFKRYSTRTNNIARRVLGFKTPNEMIEEYFMNAV